MRNNQKIYIGATVAAFFAIALILYAWSNHKIAKLENAVESAKADAADKQHTANAKETEAAQYKQKIDYLEAKLTEVRQIARKQDEQLENLSTNSRTARSDVERARNTRTVTATHAELCEKLAELGHPCQ